jgi:hypothetical protein
MEFFNNSPAVHGRVAFLLVSVLVIFMLSGNGSEILMSHCDRRLSDRLVYGEDQTRFNGFKS